tara:strand:+ start:238 stop:426 length:189 start_codon:yes stop_codon:yes gene_type:complete
MRPRKEIKRINARFRIKQEDDLKHLNLNWNQSCKRKNKYILSKWLEKDLIYYYRTDLNIENI